MNVRKLFLMLSFMIVSCGNDLAPQSFPEQTLVADGNDEATYSLILNKGYNYETPDNSGAHSSAPYRHLRQSFDESLGKYVFDFILHIENDDDRGGDESQGGRDAARDAAQMKAHVGGHVDADGAGGGFRHCQHVGQITGMEPAGAVA